MVSFASLPSFICVLFSILFSSDGMMSEQKKDNEYQEVIPHIKTYKR